MTTLAASTRRLADLLAVLDADAVDRPVTACPGWTVRDLVAHVGHVHQWATHAVLAGDPRVRAEGLPSAAPASEVAAWYRRHADRLVEVLDGRPADAAAWSFSPPHQHVGFWQRRQLHEVLLHTRDVLDALGRVEQWVLEPAVAWDGVGEVAEMFYPRQVALGRTEPLPRPLRLVATDLDVEPVTIGDGEAPLELAAPAATLLLVLWHRVPCPDPAAAELTAYALTP
ncbi:maleylpyruvate isomerase family mycothiol-dependent enzyme [Nocardioides sp. SYSU DS0663]|uniref:maleylpyruvate isomerase family mycothiol-dependent enzyme n=1 Tax=Nocardioides sp. SYSU DS0663 TaxID=3416445 RepID=UPI003F4B13C4